MVLIFGRSKPVFRPLALLILCITLVALGGCAAVNLETIDFSKIFAKKKSPTANKTAEQLIDMGKANLRAGKFSEAADDFKKLKEEYPYSKFATLASLKLGDAYFGEQKWAQAAMSYKEFARLHPNNENAPYVLYQAGVSYFLMFTTADRDSSETTVAIKIFNTVIENYPGSEYALKARKQLIECHKRLASHLFCVGKQYFVSEDYFAAKARLDALQQKYPQEIVTMGYGSQVERMLAKCNSEVAKGPKKPDIWIRMGL
ncbi:MAG: outer membrane protein assembly factor BamD [Syntrophobacteraceae bacterium]|nr:outer membrane protein assembly factor BamD [Syntrophobacteraceae bacterium]